MLGDVTNVAPDGTKQFQRRKPQQKVQAYAHATTISALHAPDHSNHLSFV